MKAVLLRDYGDVDKLELAEAPEPKVGAGEIEVRVVGASINPIDWKLRSGQAKGRIPLDLPAILGRDASGEVIEVGSGTKLRVGARVTGLVMGAYAERVVAKEEAWAEVPAKLDLIDAAAIPLVALTGSQLIDEGVQPRAGDTVLVTGAVGGVGRAAVFTARQRGAKVWAGVRATQKEEASQLGADGVVALDDPAALDRLPMLDGLADTVGGETTQRLLPRVKAGGTVGSVLGPTPGAKERGLVVRAFFAHPDPKRLAEMVQAVADGRFVIPIAKRMPLAEIREAQRLAEKGAGGKVILRV